MEITDKSDKDKPKPWICHFCGSNFYDHARKPTGCGWMTVCPPKAALSGKEE